jgi:antitoxin ParD1/3/4
MATLEISLPEPMKQFVEAQIAAGGFRDASEYVQALIRNAFQAQERAALEAKLLEGIRALDRGEGRVMTDQDWQRLEDRLEEHIRSREGS